jgi:Tol biopolymer transport system component
LTRKGYSASWSPSGDAIAFTGGSFNWLLLIRPDGSGLRVLSAERTDSVWRWSRPAWSPDGRKIAFVAAGAIDNVYGDYVIEIVDIVSGGLVAVTRHSGAAFVDRDPAWSPDGRRLVFVRSSGGGVRRAKLEVVGADGSDERALASVRLREERYGSPSWSPDGRRIAFSDAEATKVVSARGGRVVRVGPPVATGHALLDAAETPIPPTWSPDGGHLAIVAASLDGSDVSTVALGSRRMRRLTRFVGRQVASEPIWSEGGRRLEFSTTPSYPVTRDLHAVGLGGSDRLLTGTDAVTERDPAWSPDGRRLAFTHDDVFARRLAIRGPGARTVLLGRGEQPSWSPDGRRLAFVRDQVLWVRNLRTRRERRLVAFARATAADPAWSPDGRLIAFTLAGARPPWGEVVAVVRPDGRRLRVLVRGPARACAAPHGARQPDWSPDGKQLVVLEETQLKCTGYDDFGVGSLVVVRRDGRGRRVLVNGGSFLPGRDLAHAVDCLCRVGAFEPSWSPDGRTIAFAARTRALAWDAPSELMVVHARGGPARTIGVGDSPDWRPR